VIAMPHIGASTEESEENCAVMAANQLMDFLENGNITNSVNFPAVRMARTPGTWRITFANDNVLRRAGQCAVGAGIEHQVNVVDMMNKSRGELAFNIMDVEHAPSAAVVAAIQATEHVVRVRVIAPGVL
jgi:D-3-phosphoglycerate dehydrogenase